MITKQKFNFSDSLVMKELERIARERKIVEEEPELFVPELEQINHGENLNFFEMS